MTSVVRTLAVLTLVPFTLLTAVSFAVEGLAGFPAAILHNLHSVQIFTDLVIVIGFWCAWVIRDRGHAVDGWVWALAALVVGSFAPLLYAMLYGRWPGSAISGGPQRAPGTLAIGVLGLFTVLTGASLWVDGFNVPASVAHSWCSLQIWADLAIAICFWFGWVLADARARGTSGWGWVALGAAIGAFAPLGYLAFHSRWPASHPVSGRPPLYGMHRT